MFLPIQLLHHFKILATKNGYLPCQKDIYLLSVLAMTKCTIMEWIKTFQHVIAIEPNVDELTRNIKNALQLFKTIPFIASGHM